MKGLVGLAVLLGIAGTVLGVIALMDGGAKFEEETLELTGGEPEELTFAVEAVDKGHPFGEEGFRSQREITGDATGEHVVTCVPIGIDHVECHGAFILEEGEIEFDGTEPGEDDGQATSAITGGTGAYDGATGEVDINYEDREYSLHMHIPQDD